MGGRIGEGLLGREMRGEERGREEAKGEGGDGMGGETGYESTREHTQPPLQYLLSMYLGQLL